MRETSRDVTSSTMRGGAGMAEEGTRAVTGLRRVAGAGDPGEAEALVEVGAAEVVTCMTRVQEDSEEETEASPRGEEAGDMRCLHPQRG